MHNRAQRPPRSRTTRARPFFMRVEARLPGKQTVAGVARYHMRDVTFTIHPQTKLTHGITAVLSSFLVADIARFTPVVFFEETGHGGQDIEMITGMQ